jgi:hypothetical protein
MPVIKQNPSVHAGSVNTYTPERVTLELSRDEFSWLRIALSHAAAYATEKPAVLRQFLEVSNAINRGNPDWTPYEVPEENP